MIRALVVGLLILVGGGSPGNDFLVQPGGSASVATSVADSPDARCTSLESSHNRHVASLAIDRMADGSWPVHEAKTLFAVYRRKSDGCLAALLDYVRHMFDSLPEPPGPIVVGARGTVVAGDTLVYTVSWGPGARATSYDVTRSVGASNGAWSVVADSQSGVAKNIAAIGSVPLPNTFSYGRPVISHRMWLTAVPWDSATFTVTVVSRNSVGVSAPVSATWTVKRKPGVPGPIVVDSSLIVIGILVEPKPVTLALGSSRIMCAFQVFGNGAVAQFTPDKPSCDSIYVAYITPAARGLVNVAQQAHTDSISKTCVTWSTTAPSTALTMTPLAPCSAAVLVTGIGLTWVPVDALWRYGRAAP